VASEARMNLLVPKYDRTFTYVYDMAHLSGPTELDIIATRPWVILNGRIRQNERYVPPEVYLHQLLGRERTGRRVA
jgi:hypothetical protein